MKGIWGLYWLSLVSLKPTSSSTLEDPGTPRGSSGPHRSAPARPAPRSSPRPRPALAPPSRALARVLHFLDLQPLATPSVWEALGGAASFAVSTSRLRIPQPSGAACFPLSAQRRSLRLRRASQRVGLLAGREPTPGGSHCRAALALAPPGLPLPLRAAMVLRAPSLALRASW